MIETCHLTEELIQLHTESEQMSKLLGPSPTQPEACDPVNVIEGVVEVRFDNHLIRIHVGKKTPSSTNDHFCATSQAIV